jgi:nicotinamidase-related amidase
MLLALSTALLVIDGGAQLEGAVRLIDGFKALNLPVLHIDGFDRKLEAQLEEQGILTLVICGDSGAVTARQASELGFRVFEASDAAGMAEAEAALEALAKRRA